MPEAYCQLFRNGRKEDEQSYLEFSCHLLDNFSRWRMALGVDTFEDVCDLVVLEQFKNAVPNRIAAYIAEQQVKTVGDAAALADQYVLTHRTDWGTMYVAARSVDSEGDRAGTTGSVRSGVSLTSSRDTGRYH